MGAELWASFHDTAEVDAGWGNLTALLGAQFCASLSRLTRSEIVVEPKLAFHPWDGRVDAAAGGHPRRHGHLPAEAVCTENITPWIKLLPCRDQAGLGVLLRSRSDIFGSNYVSFSVRARTMRVGGEGKVKGEWAVELTQAITIVLDVPAPTHGAQRHGGDTGWSLSKTLGLSGGGGVRGACAVASTSAVHVETHRPYAVELSDGVKLPRPVVHSGVAEAGEGPVMVKTWDLIAMGDGGETFDMRITPLGDVAGAGAGGGTAEAEGAGGALSSASGVATGKDLLLRAVKPAFYAERMVTGSGYHRGGLSIELRRSNIGGVDGSEGGGTKTDNERTSMRVRVFQVLPWYVRVFIHTLTVEFDGVPVPVPTSSTASGSQHSRGITATDDAAWGGVGVEGMRWVPGADRRRPSTMELQLLIPTDVSVVRMYVDFEKAFLRVAEFPPDANRGFDIPAALVLLPPPRLVRFNRTTGSGVCFGHSPLLDAVEGRVMPQGSSGDWGSDSYFPEALYMNGLLLPWPTPDFSMAFNIITMVCTLMALLCGSLLSILTQRPGWVGFDKVKAFQRARLAQLAKQTQLRGRRV